MSMFMNHTMVLGRVFMLKVGSGFITNEGNNGINQTTNHFPERIKENRGISRQ
jgi:hypothetical protein